MEPKCVPVLFYSAMSLNAERYRRYLQDARQHADLAVSPAEREAWGRMAERWLRLLVLAERPAQSVVALAPKRGVKRLVRD